MTNQTPCSCGGTNENCVRCYGRGFIEHPNRKTSRNRSKSRSYDAFALSSAARTIICPVCKFNGTTEEFTKHFALVHGSKRRRGTIPARFRVEPGPCCPLCNCRVRGDRLQKHMRDRCPQRMNRNAHLTSRIKSATRPPRKESSIALRDVQLRERSKKRDDAANTREKGTPESARQIGNVKVERPSWGDYLDATKNCGYPAREEGRYGSYPSHDGFDDESKP